MTARWTLAAIFAVLAGVALLNGYLWTAAAAGACGALAVPTEG